MALVMNKDNVTQFFAEKMAIQNGETTTHSVDGVKYFDEIKYPSQEGFESGATVIVMEKPMWDFAAECGDKGAMTAQMIMDKISTVSEEVATVLANEFAIFYANYVIIPGNCALIMTMAPYNSIHDLTIPDPPVDTEDMK